MFPVAKPKIGEREKQYIAEVMDTGWISFGRFVTDFEARFAEFCGVRYGVSTSSGTTALHLALASLGIKPGDEVLVPNLTYVATANAVTYVGAKAGAMRTTGTEPENRLNTTKLAANWVGNFNGEFYGFDLKGATTQNLKERFGVDGFDVVLFLAMGNHVGHFPEYLGGMCKDLLVYEQNENGIPVNEMISGIKNLGFSTVEYRGIASDVGGRNIYVARK